MCRLLGVVTSRPAPLERVLASDLAAFRRLADEHGDGWGLAYHPAAGAGGSTDGGPDGRPDGGAAAVGGPVVRKAPGHALSDTGFDAAVRDAETAAALVHLRNASVGMPLTPANTHPFAADGVALAHNGWFAPRSAVDPLAERTGYTCAGDTDSERYFALVLAGLRAGPGHEAPHLALAGAAARIDAVAEIESLNALLLTPDALFAYARYEPSVVLARGGDADSYGMAYRTDTTPDGAWRVVVASNGWEQPSPAWRPLPNGSVLEVRRDGDVRLHDSGAWRRAG
jgi:predicted glutamine amidotransferase